MCRICDDSCTAERVSDVPVQTPEVICISAILCQDRLRHQPHVKATAFASHLAGCERRMRATSINGSINFRHAINPATGKAVDRRQTRVILSNKAYIPYFYLLQSHDMLLIYYGRPME